MMEIVEYRKAFAGQSGEGRLDIVHNRHAYTARPQIREDAIEYRIRMDKVIDHMDQGYHVE